MAIQSDWEKQELGVLENCQIAYSDRNQSLKRLITPHKSNEILPPEQNADKKIKGKFLQPIYSGNSY